MHDSLGFLFLGDFAPSVDQQNHLLKSGHDFLGGLKDDIGVDHVVINLEAPITAGKTPSRKVGPSLSLSPSIVEALRAAGISIASLANNHIRDYGKEGILDTIKALESVDILSVGAGASLSEAEETLCLRTDKGPGLDIGIIAVAEREFNIATSEEAGAAPLDPVDTARAISTLKRKNKHVIVLVHGGLEHTPYPPAHLRKSCQFFIEQGAGAVICSHTHVPGCFEEYQGGFICYGLGNVLMRQRPDKSDWDFGYAVLLQFGPDGISGYKIKPYVIDHGRMSIHQLEDTDKDKFLLKLERQNEVLKDPLKLKKELDDMYSRKQAALVSLFAPKFLRILSRLPGGEGLLLKMFQDNLLGKLNMIQNPSHREVLLSNLNSIFRS